jgi:hypothetical protein
MAWKVTAAKKDFAFRELNPFTQLFFMSIKVLLLFKSATQR